MENKNVGESDGTLSVTQNVQANNKLIESDFSFINGNQDTTVAPVSSDANPQVLVDGPHVLVVEDNVFVLESVSAALEGAGYHVLKAEDGQVALNLFKKHSDQISLMVLDECMPKLSGLELLDRIHQTSPSTCFILSSGYYGDDSKPPVAESSYVSYLAKPYTIPHLLQVVGRFLKPTGEAEG